MQENNNIENNTDSKKEMANLTAKSKIDMQIEKAKAKIAELQKAKRQAESKEKSAALKKARNDETRKKILLGAFMLQKMKNNAETKQKITFQLDEYLTEDRDRKLFDLEPKL